VCELWSKLRVRRIRGCVDETSPLQSTFVSLPATIHFSIALVGESGSETISDDQRGFGTAQNFAEALAKSIQERVEGPVVQGYLAGAFALAVDLREDLFAVAAFAIRARPTSTSRAPATR